MADPHGGYEFEGYRPESERPWHWQDEPLRTPGPPPRRPPAQPSAWPHPSPAEQIYTPPVGSSAYPGSPGEHVPAGPPYGSSPYPAAPAARPPAPPGSRRHAADRRSRRDRRPKGRAASRSLVIGLVLVVVAGLGVYFGQSLTEDGCGGRDPMRLAATAEVAPLLEEAAAGFGVECPAVSVSPLEPGQGTSTLADDGFAGWVPASSAWLEVAAAAGPGADPEAAADESTADGRSLVRAPLVVAAPQPLAEALGWPEQQPTWAELTAAVVGGAIPRFTMESPVRSPTGLLATLGVHAAMAETTEDPGIAQLRALTLRSRLADADADTAALLRELETISDPEIAVAQVGAFPLTEQALRAYQQQDPALPLVPIYPADGLLEADYPLVLTDAATGSDRELASRLVERFHSAEFAETVDEHGFRPVGPTDDGGAEDGAPALDDGGLLLEYPAPAGLPDDPAAVPALATQWAEYQQLAFQTLILVDASASMNDPVEDSSGNQTTKAELLRVAGVQAAQLFGLDTSLGMWMFATPTPDSPAHVEVVPFGPLDEPVGGVLRRELIQDAAADYQPFEAAGTPLYETVLEGVRTMQPLVKPDTVTLVVVLTDGRDEDTVYAMPHQEFMSELAAAQDPERPVPVFSIGYGEDADMAALTDLSEATGGVAQPSNDPGDLATAIARIFLAAHSVE